MAFSFEIIIRNPNIVCNSLECTRFGGEDGYKRSGNNWCRQCICMELNMFRDVPLLRDEKSKADSVRK